VYCACSAETPVTLNTAAAIQLQTFLEASNIVRCPIEMK
jgi:hypothetical protein